MSLKLKILGLGVLAIMATGAFAAMNASATVTGHFTHEGATESATIFGTENFGTAHMLEFQRTAPTGSPTGAAIACTEATYHGTVSAKTVQSINITPTYNKCATTGGVWGEVVVTMNGCNYVFHSNSAASTHTPTAHATVTVNCPVDQAIEIHHPNCTITVGPQTPKGGVTYTTTVENKHALTVNVTATHIVGEFHGGACIFLGTTKEFDMTGSVTVKGEKHGGGEQIGITAT